MQPNNHTLISIANQYGTPVYVYDAAKIISQYQKLKNAFAGNCPRPAEVLVYKSNIHLIRKRETIDDMIQNIVEVEL